MFKCDKKKSQKSSHFDVYNVNNCHKSLAMFSVQIDVKVFKSEYNSFIEAINPDTYEHYLNL